MVNLTPDVICEIEDTVEKYSDMVYRICYVSLKNKSDIEDVFQEVFLKLLQRSRPFENELHKKAWLCRVAFNKCKDQNRSSWLRKVERYDEQDAHTYLQANEINLLNALQALPDNYRKVIYLHYYEGYQLVEIAKMLNKNHNTIYTWLRRAKARIKTQLKEEYIDEGA
ncbi:MAG TPA: sigma-70 family RNA polymerase sigma factor [Clostridia bacterium]|nr:sigma-70 family RNA polymerase sigma factor [Clostridia bacterium]